MTEPTTRTQTFVFTDIEGSTRLLRALGPDYDVVLRAHDRALIDAAEAEGGEAIGSEGDAQHFVFDDPAAAVRAATAALRSLEHHDWPEGGRVRARMGIHTGEARRDETGFVGLVLHETARICAAAHGGQVLLSPATAELVRGRLPAGVTLLDLGEHELKDLEAPLHLYQLRVDGLQERFPPLRARPRSRVHLPTARTSFVERGEVDAVVDLAERSRLVTLTGPGGTGKTRLAIASAERLAERFDDGTWFVALDALTEADLVVPEIVAALGIAGGTDAPLERLLHHLHDRSVLLVLDNLEQVVGAGPDIGRIVAQCPRVTIIVTSRVRLRVYGEQAFAVPALPLPTAPLVGDVTALREVASVRLFEERARAAEPSFEVDQANAADVAEVVRRLDGLPLAIELAAARIRLLHPAALRARLDDRLGILTGGARDRPGRQRTLRGAIAWSHDLLDEPDRRLFARFGVIAASASLSQVEATCGPAAEIGRDVLDGLDSLAEQSLLRVLEGDEDEPRFAMLSTIREYARERLAESGEAPALERRHAEAYLALAEEAEPWLLGPHAARWNDRLENDHDDLRATLDWAVAQDEAEFGLRLIVALWRFWQVRGHLYEASDRIDAVLRLPSVPGQPTALRARAHLAAGGVAYWRMLDAATHDHYTAALELARQTDDRALLAECLYNAGFVPYVAQMVTGEEHMERGAAFFEEALEIYRELDDQAGIARTSWSLAIQAAARSDVQAARALVTSSLEASRAIGDTYQVGWALHTLGQTDVVVGDLDAAAHHLRESLDLWVASGDMSAVTLLLVDAVVVARARGAEACSWRLIGAEERLSLSTGAALAGGRVEFPELEPRRTPASDEERAWLEEGRRLSLEAAIALARDVALATD
ncbi:MAG: AAA family ATPase [Candidatus Limnocylindrales bacterium]